MTMTVLKRRSRPQSAPSLTLAGNGEERAAQVDRIQERLDRLRRFAADITAEIAAVTTDLSRLTEPPVGAPTTPKSN